MSDPKFISMIPEIFKEKNIYKCLVLISVAFISSIITSQFNTCPKYDCQDSSRSYSPDWLVKLFSEIYEKPTIYNKDCLTLHSISVRTSCNEKYERHKCENILISPNNQESFVLTFGMAQKVYSMLKKCDPSHPCLHHNKINEHRHHNVANFIYFTFNNNGSISNIFLSPRKGTFIPINLQDFNILKEAIMKCIN